MRRIAITKFQAGLLAVVMVLGTASIGYIFFWSCPDYTYPTTFEEIEDFNNIEFYSCRTKLVGKLSRPQGEGPFSALVWIHGSGQMTRYLFDSLIGGFTSAGFVCFQYDKRGCGESEGIYPDVGGGTGNELQQLADDALAAVAFLKSLQEVNSSQIGLIGASQAGWIIPIRASLSSDIAYTVIVDGPTVPVGVSNYWAELTDGSTSFMNSLTETDFEDLSEQLAEYSGAPGFDPRQSLEAMSVPGLWIWGGRDQYVPTRESSTILEDISADLGKDFTILWHANAHHNEWTSTYTNEILN